MEGDTFVCELCDRTLPVWKRTRLFRDMETYEHAGELCWRPTDAQIVCFGCYDKTQSELRWALVRPREETVPEEKTEWP